MKIEQTDVDRMEIGSLKEEDYRKRMIVALDVKNQTEALELISRFEGQLRYVKVGMELFYATGYPLIEKLKKQGLNIFLDLKMHDIPNTVGKTAAQLTRLEIDMFNLHIAGGMKMMEAARNQMENTLAVGQKRPLLIGVTQLTSTDQSMLQNEIGIPSTVEESVLHYSKLAQLAGLDGVVSSPLEVKKIKAQSGLSFLTVTPGIRLVKGLTHDQKRVTTPEKAFQLGADYIVIGRAVTEAENPAKVFATIIKRLKGRKDRY